MKSPVAHAAALAAVTLAAACATLASAPALAAANPVTLDFEGVSGYANPIGNYYNGGTDGSGRVGPNLGVSFTDSAVALSNDASFPAYFSHAPSPTTAMFVFDASAFMNVAGGFVDSLSFFYSSPSTLQNVVDIYSGLNGSGSVLASVSLFGNAQVGCSDSPYCRFDLATVRFAGVGRSVSFGTVSQDVLYDDISLTPAVPEPSTWGLTGAGLALLAVIGRGRRDRRA